MGYVLKAVLSSAQHPEYGQITVPFPIPDEKYDRMIELLEPLEIGDALRQDCRVDELDSFYTVLNRLVGSLVNFDELDYLAKRLDSFDDGEAAQFQGMACKLGVSNIKDFINLTFCCQQATVITDFSDLDAIGRQHYMTMQGGGCRIEELERLDGRKFALDLILNHLEGRITPYGVVYDSLSFRAVSLRHDTKSQRHRTLLRQRTDGKFFRHAQKREDLPDRGIQATERTGQNDHFSLYFYLLQPRQGLYTQPAWAAACEVPGVGAGADGSLIRCRRSFPAFRYAPLRKTALYYHAFQILGVSRLHIS